MANHKSETVAFRADPGLLRLIDQAAKNYGISRGAWVKNVVTEKAMEIHDPKETDTSNEVTTTIALAKREIVVAIARSLFYVLTNPDGLSAEEVNQIVREKILTTSE